MRLRSTSGTPENCFAEHPVCALERVCVYIRGQTAFIQFWCFHARAIHSAAAAHTGRGSTGRPHSRPHSRSAVSRGVSCRRRRGRLPLCRRQTKPSLCRRCRRPRYVYVPVVETYVNPYKPISFS